MNPWELPRTALLGGRAYAIRADFRDVLDILHRLDDDSEPPYIRWQVALALFYPEGLPPALHREGAEFLTLFLNGGVPEPSAPPAPRLLDWQQDAGMIAAEVNKVAGCEVRALPFLHWWTFLGWFGCVGAGQLSTVVSIRSKLRRGKKLEKWEQEFYRENKARVDLPRRRTAEEDAERARLKELLGE